jgi:hypothetical protein
MFRALFQTAEKSTSSCATGVLTNTHPHPSERRSGERRDNGHLDDPGDDPLRVHTFIHRLWIDGLSRPVTLTSASGGDNPLPETPCF